MRVLYDGVIYRIQRYGGVVRYFNGLIHHLPSSIHPILLAPNKPAVAPQHPNLSIFIETCEAILWPIKPLRKSIIAHRSFKRVVAEKPDVIHPTYYYSSLRHLNQQVHTPTVLTVYDLIHEKFPDEMDPHGKQRRLKQMAVERADAIICISKSTKSDLQKYYRLPDERIRVIYPGSEFVADANQSSSFQNGPQNLETLPRATEPSFANVESNANGDDPYLLYVGERNFYKNFDRMLEAFARVTSTHKNIRLLCVGGKPFSRSEKKLIGELGIAGNVSRQAFLSDHEMQSVYANALAVIYPSLYEGFGIPILEGMACGTAVLTSDRASMPEVAGDAAIFFDPYSVDQIADAMMEVHEDRSKRAELIAQGLKRAQQFSFSRCAADTADIYRSVAKRSEAAA